MKTIEGNIVDVVTRTTKKGIVYFDTKIRKIEYDDTVLKNQYIMPGFVDAHVHIESSMLTPVEYSKVALKHGVVAAITDPHEIANVCGLDGVLFMIENAIHTPMKIFFGAPSCVPATDFETSGGKILPNDIEYLFKNSYCSHLSEMMNYPGVIFNDTSVCEKIAIAQKYGMVIDGHAPLLNGNDLQKYIDAGISTDHECTNLTEAYEKIAKGMKIMLRNSSASKDFDVLIDLIKTHPDDVMLCTDDCHPDDLYKGYINKMVKVAIDKGYNFYDVMCAATKNIVNHYNFNIGLLQQGDDADFIVLDNIDDFHIRSTYISGNEVFSNNTIQFSPFKSEVVNNFYTNIIDERSIVAKNINKPINVIQIVPDSLLTKRIDFLPSNNAPTITSDIKTDILKVVVLNRYTESKPQVGFIKGYGLKKGSIASTVAHDSHNIIAVGVTDDAIVGVIKRIQQLKGGLVVYDGKEYRELGLPFAGLMSDKPCEIVAKEYEQLNSFAKTLGTQLNTPFMTLAFLSLLVIPELKIGDKGLFDVNQFKFIELHN